MTCGTCGNPCDTEEHKFIVGSFERPERQWTIIAPLYFKATPDGRACEVPFCGPACATAHYLLELRS